MISRPTCRLLRFFHLACTDCRSAEEHLKKKGFTIEGGKAHLKVKTVDNHSYIDKTQQFFLSFLVTNDRAFVRAWNNSETRGYYSRLWSKEDLRDKPKST
jgi:hypothetical protein